MFRIMIILLGLASFTYAETIQANVTAVTTNGNEGAYRFSVTLKSTETGCEQYADWWEVLSEEGELLYRRILVHSHPDTQPFTRSGGKVNIGGQVIVIAPKAILRYTYQQQIQHEDLKCLEDRE